MPVSAEFPFESKFVEVLGSRIHYVDEGHGDPVLFLHGNPTSSYLWRNVIPHVLPKARCIAPDLIGMGKSGKPDIPYRFFDHVEYLEAFIDELGLANVTLVLHDWGSGLGFYYAMRHEENIKGLAFMESILWPVEWSDFPADYKISFLLFRTPLVGKLMIMGMNLFINQILPKATDRTLTAEEMDIYRQPFPTYKSRLPVWRWPNEVPISGKPSDVHEAVVAWNAWLQRTHLPKLLLYTKPGGLIDERRREWCYNNLPNLTAASVGRGVHFIQEDNPTGIGQEIAGWYTLL